MIHIHWKSFTQIVLASVLCLWPARGTAQSDCELPPAETQTSPPPSKPDVRLFVQCVVNDADACDDKTREQLEHHLKLRVPNINVWAAQGNSPWNLILFINERPLKGLHPVSVNPQKCELVFKLSRTDESAPTWDDLMARGKNWKWYGISRKARPGIGLEVNLASKSEGCFELVFLSTAWLLVCLGFALCTLVTLILLAYKTPLLRDAIGGPFSLSRVQMAVWTWALLNGYFFLFVMTWNPKIDIPTSMLGLLGISATTYVAAVLVDQTSGTTGTQTTPIQTTPIQTTPIQTTPIQSAGFWKDITGGASVSLHRVQLISWTIVLVFVFVVRVLTRMNIPDFNATLLGLLGLSAGTYVGFKFPENRAPAQSTPNPPANPSTGQTR